MSDRFKNFFHLLLNVTGLLGCIVTAEVLLYRHNVRFDFTEEKLFSISEHTKQIVAALEEPVEVVAFTRSGDPRNGHFEDLLRQAKANSEKFSFELIDVNRHPARAQKYGASTYGAVFVESGGRRKQFSNMSEQLLVAAMIEVTRPQRKKVVALIGHSGSDFDASDHRSGYSRARVALERESYDFSLLRLRDGEDIARDVAVVVIAGPRQDIPSYELAALGRYLDEGGALLVLLDPGGSPSLVEFLKRYGVGLPEEVVADGDYALGSGEPLTARVPGRSQNSMVTRTLTDDPVFSLTRPVVAIPASREVHHHRLLSISANGWVIPAPGGIAPNHPAFDASRDRRGEIAVGLEVAIPLGKEVDPNEAPLGEAIPRPVSRIMVYGDADFANNFLIQYLGNQDLFVNSVNWLAREHGLIGVRPFSKERFTEQFYVTRSQMYWAFMTGTVIQPSIFLALGAVVFLWRRLR